MFYGSQFVTAFPGAMTLISIADPGLRLSQDTLYTWYAGDEACATQAAIHQLCAGISEQLRPRKTVFIGGSSGAHPALLHSHAVPGSICLSVNPLASISAYPTNLQRYAALCWPGRPVEDIGKLIADDVFGRYAAGYDNKVIVLQNCMDPHLKTQILPLAASLARQPDAIFLSEFFKDYLGHSYPPGPLNAWLAAVIGVEGGALPEIAEMAVRRSDAKSALSGKADISKTSTRAADPEKSQLADRIATDLLRSAT